MKLYRYSPIKTQSQLLEALKYTHLVSLRLCKKVLGEYLPVAGNFAIFCHYGNEFEYLTDLRKHLTREVVHFNNKYFQLIEPIIIPIEDGMPETTYEFMYVRRADPYRGQVGDVDFVMDPKKFAEFVGSLKAGKQVPGARIIQTSGLDLVELYDPDFDVLAYVTDCTMAEQIARG